MLKQAERQSAAGRVTGTLVEWHVAEGRVARLLDKIFTDKDLYIKVVHTPSKP